MQKIREDCETFSLLSFVPFLPQTRKTNKSVTQTFPVSSLCAVAAGPVAGVQLQPRTFPVSPSGSTQPAANHLKPAENNNNSMVTEAQMYHYTSATLSDA